MNAIIQRGLNVVRFLINLALVIVLWALVLAVVLLLAYPTSSHADEIWFSPYSHTRHYRYHGYYDAAGIYRKYQDSHPSIGFEFVGPQGRSISVGAYNDSRGQLAAYVARRWDYGYGAGQDEGWPRAAVGLAAGTLLGPGYRRGFCPFVGPELAVTWLATRLSVGVIPGFGIEGKSNLVVAKFAIKWE